MRLYSALRLGRSMFLLTVVISALVLPLSSAQLKATTSSKEAPAIPPFEEFFAQDFRVSVITESYGAFNATLRMRASLNFPEKVQGELIPIGNPKQSHPSQMILPHFQRTRLLEDDKLSDLLFSSIVGTGKGRNKSSRDTGERRSGELTSAGGEEERPSLLVIDLNLQHSDAMQGTATVFYLPAELMALRAQREEMREGSALPSASVEFVFRPETSHMTDNPLSDVSALARVSSAPVFIRGEYDTHELPSTPGEKNGETRKAAAQGGIIFRWVTEHEFSAHVMIPMADEGSATTTRLERIWVYGYATPSKRIFNRSGREVPWYNRYMMIGVGLLGFLMQVVSGIAEGKKRAKDEADHEAAKKAEKNARLEAQLLEQEKKKK